MKYSSLKAKYKDKYQYYLNYSGSLALFSYDADGIRIIRKYKNCFIAKQLSEFYVIRTFSLSGHLKWRWDTDLDGRPKYFTTFQGALAHVKQIAIDDTAVWYYR